MMPGLWPEPFSAGCQLFFTGPALSVTLMVRVACLYILFSENVVEKSGVSQQLCVGRRFYYADCIYLCL